MFIYQRPKHEQDEIRKMIQVDQGFRVRYFEEDFYCFFVYHFCENLIFGVKDFHREWCEMCVSGMNFEVLGFRGSGKTTIIAQAYILWCIVYKKETFIIFLAFELQNAEEKVMNVGNVLRGINSVTFDYGFVLERSENNVKQEDRMSKFKTSTGVKVQAVSLKNQKRGQMIIDPETMQIARPSLVVGDDIDVDESVVNVNIIQDNYYKLTSSVFNSIEGRFFLLGNIIREDGVNVRVRDRFAIPLSTWLFSSKALIENGVCTWIEKHPMTIAEAAAKSIEVGKKVRSVEELQTDEEVFNCDYLNLPKSSVMKYVFNHKALEVLTLKDVVSSKEVKLDDSRLAIVDFYQEIDESQHYYVSCGLDTSSAGGTYLDNEGNQVEVDKDNDFSDITLLNEAGELFARVRNNKIDVTDIEKILYHLVDELKMIFLKGSLVIERNYLGTELIARIRKKRPDIAKKIFRKTTDDKGKLVYVSQLGWWTDQTSKNKMITSIKLFIKSEKMQLDEVTKQEFRGFCEKEVKGRVTFGNDGIIAQHDDSVISYALAYQGYLQHNS